MPSQTEPTTSVTVLRLPRRPVRLARVATVVAGVTLAAMLSGCSTTGAFPPAPLSVPMPEASAKSNEPKCLADSSDCYKIGPLDTLTIVVWRNPELSMTVTVRPDGLIAIPLIDEIPAAGRNPTQLAHEITAKLGKYVVDPVVSVVVSNFQGVYSDQIRIVGEAAKTQSVPYRKDMTVLDVMIQVGGITDFADGNGAVLVRGHEHGKQYSLRLKDLLKRGDISANAAMMPGDIIIVPQSWF